MLEIISKENEIGIRELSRRVNLSRSTVHNLVSTLVEEGFLLQNPANSKYRLSFKLHNLGRRALLQFDLRTAVRPFLEKLILEVQETVVLGVLDDREIIYVDRIALHEYFSFVGNRDPVYCTGIGKAILSHLPDIEQRQILTKLNEVELKAFTKNTITNIEDLKQNLNIAKSRGFAVSYEERLPGVVSVAAPLKDYRGVVIGAIAVHGFINTISKERALTLGKILLRVSKEISSLLGYNEEFD